MKNKQPSLSASQSRERNLHTVRVTNPFHHLAARCFPLYSSGMKTPSSDGESRRLAAAAIRKQAFLWETVRVMGNTWTGSYGSIFVPKGADPTQDNHTSTPLLKN